MVVKKGFRTCKKPLSTQTVSSGNSNRTVRTVTFCLSLVAYIGKSLMVESAIGSINASGQSHFISRIKNESQIRENNVASVSLRG